MKVRYVERFVDRLGNIRLYHRVYPGPRTPLRGPEQSPEFWEDYLAATKLTINAESLAVPINQTIGWLCNEYYTSANFQNLGKNTKPVRRGILKRFCKQYGIESYKELKPKHLRIIRDKMVDRPEAWNNLRKALIQVFKFAVNYEYLDFNPMNDVEKLTSKNKDGFHAWTLEEVEQFEKTHALGTKARLAFALLLFTGQRRGDVVVMGRQHVKDGWIKVRQEKTGKRIEIPILVELQRIIDATPTGDLTYLVTAYNKPFTPPGFGNKFRVWCDEAGLPQCSAHGLRKAAAAKLAELECTPHEIMAITGHESLKEVERYTKSVTQKRLAEGVRKKLEGQK